MSPADEPHDLCAVNLPAAEFTGSGIALGAALERAAGVVQHLAVDDVVEIGVVVVHLGSGRALRAEVEALELVIAAIEAVELDLPPAFHRVVERLDVGSGVVGEFHRSDGRCLRGLSRGHRHAEKKSRSDDQNFHVYLRAHYRTTSGVFANPRHSTPGAAPRDRRRWQADRAACVS